MIFPLFQGSLMIKKVIRLIFHVYIHVHRQIQNTELNHVEYLQCQAD